MNDAATPAIKRELEHALFGRDEFFAYAVADAAQIGDLPARLRATGARNECLFKGALGPEMLDVAPFLVPLDEDSEIFDQLFDEGWGKGWAIYLVSEHAMLDMRRHLRRLSFAEMPDGEVVYFRYYDPMTLRNILPVATPEQKALMFGKGLVDSFFCESEDAAEVLGFEFRPEPAT